jgi:hypothetical protein
VKRVRLLRSEQSAAFTHKGRIVEFIIPKVVDYEVAAIE